MHPRTLPDGTRRRPVRLDLTRAQANHVVRSAVPQAMDGGGWTGEAVRRLIAANAPRLDARTRRLVRDRAAMRGDAEWARLAWRVGETPRAGGGGLDADAASTAFVLLRAALRRDLARDPDAARLFWPPVLERVRPALDARGFARLAAMLDA